MSMFGIPIMTIQRHPYLRNQFRIRIKFVCIIGMNRCQGRKKSSSMSSSIRIAPRRSFRSAVKSSSLRWKANWLRKLWAKQKYITVHPHNFEEEWSYRMNHPHTNMATVRNMSIEIRKRPTRKKRERFTTILRAGKHTGFFFFTNVEL